MHILVTSRAKNYQSINAPTTGALYKEKKCIEKFLQAELVVSILKSSLGFFSLLLQNHLTRADAVESANYFAQFVLFWAG